MYWTDRYFQSENPQLVIWDSNPQVGLPSNALESIKSPAGTPCSPNLLLLLLSRHSLPILPCPHAFPSPFCGGLQKTLWCFNAARTHGARGAFSPLIPFSKTKPDPRAAYRKHGMHVNLKYATPIGIVLRWQTLYPIPSQSRFVHQVAYDVYMGR